MERFTLDDDNIIRRESQPRRALCRIGSAPGGWFEGKIFARAIVDALNQAERLSAESFMSSGSPEQIRDWFAGQAIPLIVRYDQDYGAIAKKAFELADAMLEARAPKASASAPPGRMETFDRRERATLHAALTHLVSTRGSMDRKSKHEASLDETVMPLTDDEIVALKDKIYEV